MRIIRKMQSIDYNGSYYEITTNDAPIRIWFMSDAIIRIRVGFDGDFAEESYSLVTTAWEDRLDDVIGSDRIRVKPYPTNCTNSADSVTINSGKLRLIIRKNPMIIEIYDDRDRLLHRDIAGLAYRCDSNDRRMHTGEIMDGDGFFGFGEKTGRLNKLGTYMTMSPNDTMGYDPECADSLYKHIPFYIKCNKRSHISCGYFYHNMSECTFDMGRSHSNYYKRHSTYTTDHGDIDLFFIYGPTMADVVKSYTYLTGRSAMLPKCALGYLASSMYYSELDSNCDDKIIEFIDTARRKDIPIDGFQLSSGYTSADTKTGVKRCVFTWNKDRFQDPKKFFEKAAKRGVTITPNVKPGILTVHPNIDSFVSKDMLVLEANSNEPEVGDWWGGDGVFADFTNPKCRSEWKKLLKEHIIAMGTTSVWNDNCEYDSIIDKDARVCFDGKESTIDRTRVIQSNLMCQVSRDAAYESKPNLRPFIVCRSGHSGIQRYAQSWAGDNRTSWETLRYNIATILGMALSGVSNYGADIGGFYGPAPSGELLLRWVQCGIFMPRFSIHSVNTDNTVTEPWMYPEYTDYIRSAIKFRYRLLPHMYSLMARCHSDGDMILSPPVAVYPYDEACYECDDVMIMGRGMYIATVLYPGAINRAIYLPGQDRYYEFSYMSDSLTGTVYDGGQTITVPTALGTIPIYIASGSIIPIAGNQLMNSADKLSRLSIICIADRDGAYTYYEDDGVSNDYQCGMYHKMKIEMQVGGRISITFTHSGGYKSTIEEMELKVASPVCARSVALDKKMVPQYLYNGDYESADIGWHYDIARRTILIKYPYIDSDYDVSIDCNNMDMLGM